MTNFVRRACHENCTLDKTQSPTPYFFFLRKRNLKMELGYGRLTPFTPIKIGPSYVGRQLVLLKTSGALQRRWVGSAANRIRVTTKIDL